MSEIKPCPFCNGAAAADCWAAGNFGDREAGVICRSCGATLAEPIDFEATSDDIAQILAAKSAAWNLRARPGD